MLLLNWTRFSYWRRKDEQYRWVGDRTGTIPNQKLLSTTKVPLARSNFSSQSVVCGPAFSDLEK